MKTLSVVVLTVLICAILGGCSAKCAKSVATGCLNEGEVKVVCLDGDGVRLGD